MKLFGKTKNNKEAHLFQIENEGVRAVLTDYGATAVTLEVPDRDNRRRDIILGYDTLEEYENGEMLFGATVGRVANRIENAAFVLNGRQYHLDKNEGENCNHSGFHGFHTKECGLPEQGLRTVRNLSCRARPEIRDFLEICA